MGKTRYPGIYSRQTKRGVVYDATATYRGRQKQARGKRTLAEAKVAQDEMLDAFKKGQLGKASVRLTIEDYLRERWLPFAESELKSAESVRSYRYRVEHIVKHIGAARLASISPEEIDRFKVDMKKAGVGESMTRAAYSTLKQALRQALKWELITRDPSASTSAPPVTKREPPVLSMGQIRELFRCADETAFGAMIYLVTMTGLRWHEVAGLTWANVDFATSELRIPKSKSQSGIRAVALGPLTIQRLQDHRYEQMREFKELGAPPPALVFLSETKKPLTQAGFHQKVWAPLRKRAELEGLHFHDLRHVQATLLARAKVHPKIAQGRLGHADSKTTMDIYTHVSADEQVIAAVAVEELLRE